MKPGELPAAGLPRVTKRPRYETSWFALQGRCAALLDEETECKLMPGHLDEGRPHRSHGPRSTTRYVEYDDDGNVLRWVPPWPPAPVEYDGRHRSG